MVVPTVPNATLSDDILGLSKTIAPSEPGATFASGGDEKFMRGSDVAATIEGSDVATKLSWESGLV